MALETRTVSGATPGGFFNALNVHILYREIEAAIADGGNALNDRTLNWIRREDDNVNMDFDAALDAGELTAIDTIVSAHPSIALRQGEQRQVFEAAFPPTTGDDADDKFDIGAALTPEPAPKEPVPPAPPVEEPIPEDDIPF